MGNLTSLINNLKIFDIESEQFENVVLKFKSHTVEITVSDWVDKFATMTVEGVTPSSILWIAATPESKQNIDDYIQSGVMAVSQDVNQIVFNCENTPVNTITINLVIGNF